MAREVLGLLVGQVVDEARKLRAAIDQASFSYYQDAYDRRQYEVIGFRSPGEPFEIDGDEFDDLCSVTFFKDGTVARVVLPREQFPQAYEMQEKVRWLTARQEELERAPLTDLRLEARE